MTDRSFVLVAAGTLEAAEPAPTSLLRMPQSGCVFTGRLIGRVGASGGQTCRSQEDMSMRPQDFAPLYRSTIGFDRLVKLLDQAAGLDDNGYPPYNIERVGENHYRITMAVAGFSQD